MNQKVSVIVPIYNVEKYLNRCIKSILNQTYKNLEVILVNDGSLDKSGEIADSYSKMDKRIKVIHKENGGLSDARNAGMKQITGEYTIFVDSDDWLDEKMVEAQINISNQFQADIVQSAFYYAYDDHLLFDNRVYCQDAEPAVLDNCSLMYELVINERIKNFAWGKLYKTSLIKDLPFKKGVLFEDVFWAHHVMHRVNTFVLIHQPLYYYMQRSDSIVATYTPKNLDILKGIRERHFFIEDNYKDLIDESYRGILKTSLIHYNLLLLNRKKDKDGNLRKEIRNYIKTHYKQFKMAAIQDITLSQQLSLFYLHPLLNISYQLLNIILRKLHIKPQPAGMQKIFYKVEN
ncbi:glycosyltransferase family 2 protein [Bacillus sp. T3]|uniref:glycosyltransferase family 2 protein n=1 Tax=Bacillus sp. T3 TaxID=467262 RepID=UPI002980D34E|nr:glycosyltransferase family 2 protein [Bacillus sp. T3]